VAFVLAVVTRGPAAPGLRRPCGPGTPKLRRRRQAGQPSIPERVWPTRWPRRSPAMTPGMEKRRASSAQSIRGPSPAPGPRSHGSAIASSVRSAMSGKGMPAIPRPQENEGVGEHVRTRFHVDPKAACEIAEPLFRRTAPNEENSFLLPDRQSERSDR